METAVLRVAGLRRGRLGLVDWKAEDLLSVLVGRGPPVPGLRLPVICEECEGSRRVIHSFLGTEMGTARGVGHLLNMSESVVYVRVWPSRTEFRQQASFPRR